MCIIAYVTGKKNKGKEESRLNDIKNTVCKFASHQVYFFFTF